MDSYTVRCNADADPGSASAFMRIRIQRVKMRPERIFLYLNNVYGSVPVHTKNYILCFK